MSIALMTIAWKSDCQTGKKMVLLALCDNANDQGECYPSVSMLSKKCSMSERSIFHHIAELEKDGVIRRENRTGRSTVYHLDPCKFCTPANSAPLQILHPTPATVAPITIIEPSIEPSVKQIQKPDGVSDSVWADFKSLRKDKKAKLTQTALDGIQSESEKAGWPIESALRECCARGWTGFKADWVADKKRNNGQSGETAYQRSMREKMEQIAPSIAAKNPNAPRVIDVNPTTYFENLAKKQLENHHA